MKPLKTLGLVLVLVGAVMSIIGGGTASAETTLCKVTEDPCSEVNMYPVGTEIHGALTAGTEATLKAGFGTVKCRKPTFSAKIETTTTPEGKIASWTFADCNCPMTVVKPGRFQVHWDAEHNGTVTIKEIEITVGGTALSCFFINGFHCIYAGNIDTGVTLRGGNPAELVLNDAPLPWVGGHSGSLVCGTATLYGEYEITTPNPLFVSKGL